MPNVLAWLLVAMFLLIGMTVLFLMLRTLFKEPGRFVKSAIGVVMVSVLVVIAVVIFNLPENFASPHNWGLLMAAFAVISIFVAGAAIARLVFKADTPGSRHESKWVLGIALVMLVLMGVGANLLLF